MRALKVFEMRFERGKDPKAAMEIGVKEFLNNFDRNYFMKSDEEKIQAQTRLMDILSNIEIKEIPVNKAVYPLDILISTGNEIGDVRMFELPYGFIFILRDGRTSYLVNHQEKSLLTNNNTSPGKYAIEKLAKRAQNY